MTAKLVGIDCGGADYYLGSGILAPDDVQAIHTMVGRMIRARREARGILQSRLAARWGRNKSVLSRVESGERGIRLGVLIELSSLLTLRPSAVLYAAIQRAAVINSRIPALPWRQLSPTMPDRKDDMRRRYPVGNAGSLTTEQVSAMLATTAETLRVERERQLTACRMAARWGRKRPLVDDTEHARRELLVGDLIEWGGLLCLPPADILACAEQVALPVGCRPPWWSASGSLDHHQRRPERRN